MYFTQEDYRKIEAWLQKRAIKDTTFNQISKVTGGELIPIIQDNLNKNVDLKTLIKKVSENIVEDFFNVTTYLKSGNLNLGCAITNVPLNNRKLGLIITFHTNVDGWVLYQFTGESLNQWLNEKCWENLSGMLSTESDILPDDEDISYIRKGNKVYFKFKDKEYNPEEFSGFGRVILRKNISGTDECFIDDDDHYVNILTQEMINQRNTIYEVRYDFNLNGKVLVVPKNCTLAFNGGSINNGELVLEETALTGLLKHEDLGDAIVRGTYHKGQILSFTENNKEVLKWYNGEKWCSFINENSNNNINDEDMSGITDSIERLSDILGNNMNSLNDNISSNIYTLIEAVNRINLNCNCGSGTGSSTGSGSVDNSDINNRLDTLAVSVNNINNRISNMSESIKNLNSLENTMVSINTTVNETNTRLNTLETRVDSIKPCTCPEGGSGSGSGGGNTEPEPPTPELTYDFELLQSSVNISPNPTTPVNYSNFTEFKVKWSENIYVNANVKPYIVNSAGTLVSTAIMIGKESEFVTNGAQYVLYIGFSDAVKELVSGTYTLIIPQGCVGNADWKNSNYTSGRSNVRKTWNYNYVANSGTGSGDDNPYNPDVPGNTDEDPSEYFSKYSISYLNKDVTKEPYITKFCFDRFKTVSYYKHTLCSETFEGNPNTLFVDPFGNVRLLTSGFDATDLVSHNVNVELISLPNTVYSGWEKVHEAFEREVKELSYNENFGESLKSVYGIQTIKGIVFSDVAEDHTVINPYMEFNVTELVHNNLGHPINASASIVHIWYGDKHTYNGVEYYDVDMYLYADVNGRLVKSENGNDIISVATPYYISAMELGDGSGILNPTCTGIATSGKPSLYQSSGYYPRGRGVMVDNVVYNEDENKLTVRAYAGTPVNFYGPRWFDAGYVKADSLENLPKYGRETDPYCTVYGDYICQNYINIAENEVPMDTVDQYVPITIFENPRHDVYTYLLDSETIDIPIDDKRPIFEGDYVRAYVLIETTRPAQTIVGPNPEDMSQYHFYKAAGSCVYKMINGQLVMRKKDYSGNWNFD